jgi:hypothetical protein
MLPLELHLPRQDLDGIIDIPINFEDTEEYYDVEDGDAGVMMDDEVVVVGSTTSKKNLIECSASILLPFSEDVAFDAFSDLTRQP